MRIKTDIVDTRVTIVLTAYVGEPQLSGEYAFGCRGNHTVHGVRSREEAACFHQARTHHGAVGDGACSLLGDPPGGMKPQHERSACSPDEIEGLRV
jgi:hypothetical protein